MTIDELIAKVRNHLDSIDKDASFNNRDGSEWNTSAEAEFKFGTRILRDLEQIRRANGPAFADHQPRGSVPIAESQWALVLMLDGVKRHDLYGILGELPEADMDRLWTAYESARAALAEPQPGEEVKA